MIETDFIASFADPICALSVATIAVCIMTYAFYEWLYSARITDNRKLSRKLSVLAEICGIFGLIGLLTFAGRAKLDSNEYAKSVQAARSQSEMHTSLQNTLEKLCRPVDYKATSPTLSNGYLVEMCEFAKDYDKKRNIWIYWPELRNNVQKFAATNSTTSAKKVELLDFDKSIAKFLQSRHEANIEPIRRVRIVNQAPWLFLLFCFFAAMVSITIKLARAIVEYKHPW